MAGGKKGWEKSASLYVHYTTLYGMQKPLVTSSSANGKFQDPEYIHIHQQCMKLTKLKNVSKLAACWLIKFVADASKAQ